MSCRYLLLLCFAILLASCTTTTRQGTLAELRQVTIEIKEERIEGGLEKAMASYEQFLKEAGGSAMAPEAIRRLADLKVEKEYGLIADGVGSKPVLDAPETAQLSQPTLQSTTTTAETASFETPSEPVESPSIASQPATSTVTAGPADMGLERAGALEAVELYRKLLKEYPNYENNDQVLYQLSRAHEELGQVDEAMQVMNQLVAKYPGSQYIDEIQFRRAEYFFVRRSFLNAEEAYADIVRIGSESTFYVLALYKLGWTYYKQELYEEALDRFVALLDYKVSEAYDFEQTDDEIEAKRVQDTFRVISLSFSYLGGSDAVVDYFNRHGSRIFEHSIYANLAEYYFGKRRYNDAVKTYAAFVERNPFHRQSPHFQMRVVEINVAGGFPSLVIEAKQDYAESYAMDAAYWNHFDPQQRPDVIADLKTNLTDLGNHYHALYQNKKFKEQRRENYRQALHWYRAFLKSFPQAVESPAINYQLADLLLENKSFAEAALAYEQTSYGYPLHAQSSKAGYAAVYAYRQHLARTPEPQQAKVKRDVIRSSLQFASTYSGHKKAPVVLAAAADDLYSLEDYAGALAAARTHVETYPQAEREVRRSAWLVVAHSSYELESFSDAEQAYVEVLSLLDRDDKDRESLIDNLAASIYKQGEMANLAEDYATAAEHFLRVALMAPTSTIRPTAEYDGAAALIKLQLWSRAAEVLVGFRNTFPGHELQHEVTKKIAFVYREDGRLAMAADEYERIERESDDDELRREALLIAADLHEQTGAVEKTLRVYRRYVRYFPEPVEMNLETHDKIARILKQQGKQREYHDELQMIVDLDANAGEQRTDRMRFLAAEAALVLAEVQYAAFIDIKLVKPFAVNLRKKQQLMKNSTETFARLLDYEVGEVTTAATYYMAEIYAHFSKALMQSERPEGLSALELEEYELAIEEQAYPFEERAIEVHQSNLELMSVGIYNSWIEKSLAQLARFMPARYAKPELELAMAAPLGTFAFEVVALRPATPTGGTTIDGSLVAGVTPTGDQVNLVEPVEATASLISTGQGTGVPDTTVPQSDTVSSPVRNATGVTETGGSTGMVDDSEESVSQPENKENAEDLSTPQAKNEPSVEAVDTFMQRWAAAWSAQNIEEYFGFYDGDYYSSRYRSRSSWEQARSQRIVEPAFIEVRVAEVKIIEERSEQVVLEVVQHYRSDTYEDLTRKRLRLQHRNASWSIVAETSLETMSLERPEAHAVLRQEE